jgi:chromosome segregation ATPase
VQRCRKLSLEDDAIDLQGLTEVAAKESATMSHLQYTVQQLRKRYGLYTAVTDKQREVTRLSAQLAWAELAAAEADVTAAEHQLAELTAALQRAEAARTEHAQSVTAKTQEREALYATRVHCERAEQQARTAVAAAEDHLDSVRAPIAAENKPLRLQLEALAQRAITAAAAAQRGAVPQLQFVAANIASLQTVMADSAEQRHARQQLLSTAQAQCTTAAQQLKDAVKGAATAATAHRKCRSAVLKLEESSDLFNNAVVRRARDVKKQQATVTALHATAAGKLALASEQQVQHSESIGEQWNGQRVAVVAAHDSVQQLSKQLRRAKEALLVAVAAQRCSSSSSKAQVYEQLTAAVRVCEHKEQAVQRLQQRVSERKANYSKQKSEFKGARR